jgi:hypothetical protein
MATRRPSTPVAVPESAQKLRQTQAEYVAARPAGEPGVKPMMLGGSQRPTANIETQPEKLYTVFR